MKKASGVLFLSCFFYTTSAQLYIGTGGSITVKDSILFQTEKKKNPVPLYVEDITTIHNVEQISNIKVIVLSPLISQKSPQTSFAKTVKKPRNKRTEKKTLPLVPKQEIYLSENGSSIIICNKKPENTAVIITNSFKEKPAILQNKYKVFAAYENKVFPKQSLNARLFEKTFQSGIQIRPPPSSFNYTI